MPVNQKGFENKGSANAHNVGMQGAGGAKGSGEVYGVKNSRGLTPKKMGGGRMPLAQSPVEPKVGK